MDIRDEYRALAPKSVERVGRLLASEGRKLDEELRRIVLQTRDSLSAPDFAIWMAEALVWARFATSDADFYEAAVAFLKHGDGKDADSAARFPDRFGEDRLRQVLVAFRQWYETQRAALDTVAANATKLKAVQERALVIAERLKAQDSMRGVGLWLFCAPFKIMVVANKELWSDPRTDALLMPTGTHVDRALEQLVDDGIVALERDILAGSDGTFGDNITNLWALQIPQQELARAGCSRVSHVNSALHLLGHRA